MQDATLQISRSVREPFSGTMNLLCLEKIPS